MDEAQVKEKVAEWNEAYGRIGRELRFKDLAPESYEAEVGGELLAVCGEDVDLALAVFRHPDNEGGWMAGDVPAFLERQRS